MNPLHDPLPADGHTVRWERVDGTGSEELTLTWENEAWTASGEVDRRDADGGDAGIHYVVRLSPLWQVRQLLLFRDLDEPDLWLGTDGHGHWGEMNGAHRVDLDGGIDVALAVTPFTSSIPIRRAALTIGQAAPTVLLDVDVDTLGVVPAAAELRRVGEHRYELERAEGTTVLEVDDHGLVIDVPGRFRRV
jgi:hypothetical protein